MNMLVPVVPILPMPILNLMIEQYDDAIESLNCGLLAFGS
jgi:hypothetical protein